MSLYADRLDRNDPLPDLWKIWSRGAPFSVRRLLCIRYLNCGADADVFPSCWISRPRICFLGHASSRGGSRTGSTPCLVLMHKCSVRLCLSCINNHYRQHHHHHSRRSDVEMWTTSPSTEALSTVRTPEIVLRILFRR